MSVKKVFSTVFRSNMSIKTQVVLFMVIGFSLMTIIISLATSAGVNFQYRSLMLKNAEQITEGLAKRAIFPLLSGSEQNAQEAIDQVLGFEQVLSARILLENQEVFFTTEKFPIIVEDNKQPLATTIISNETSRYWLIKSPVFITSNEANDIDDASELELEPAKSDDLPIGYAEIIYSKSHLNDAQFQIALLITCLGVFSVFILTILLKSGLRRLFSPLGALSEIMQQSKESGEHIQATVDGAKEVRNMAIAYNNMMRVLDEQDEALKRHRDSLEQEISIRTKELVLARDEAIIASKHKSQFIANMSHELRTPIQSIIGYGELVIEELELEGNFELINDMDRIAKNSQRLLVMINSLLDLAKIESGKIELNEIKLSIAELKSNLVDTITPLANKTNNIFSLIDNSHLYYFKADLEKLEQVLLNLLSNACKFSKDSDITLTITNTRNSISFAVKDNGIGLSIDQQAYIFDEFRQVDASQSRKFSGTGLGLAISKRFVELMGGKISVESTLGVGSAFIVTLPITE